MIDYERFAKSFRVRHRMRLLQEVSQRRLQASGSYRRDPHLRGERIKMLRLVEDELDRADARVGYQRPSFERGKVT